MSIKDFLFGVIFASFIWGMLIFALSFESRIPNQSGWDARFEMYETAVTENRRLFDSVAERTILWSPGNPKTNVTEIKEIAPGKWQVVLEKIY